MNCWQRLWRRTRMEEELNKELRFHLDQQTNDLIAEGVAPLEAKRQAVIELGSTEQIKEYCRDARGTRWLDHLWLDARYALRSFRRSPGFTFAALLAIAVGIGATAAVFSVTDRILFRALPYAADGQLVSLGMLASVVDDGEFLFAGDYRTLVNSAGPFQAVTSWSGVNDCDITERNPVRQRCAAVDSNFLEVLGIRLVLGAGFTAADVRPGAAATVMLSYAVWQGHFGGDRSITGKTLMLDGAPARILGVLPASFELPTLQHAGLLVPQIILPAAYQPGATRVLRVIGRLKVGGTLQSARAQLAPYFDQILAQVPKPFRKEVQSRVRSIRDRQMGSAQLAAWTLLGGVLTVMLISCANVANLLLARMAARQTEIAIRTAIGISRGRLLCQLLTESLILAVSGGVAGCALGALLLRVLTSLDRDGIPHLGDATLDLRVLVFSLSLSVLAGLLFGLAPLFQPLRSETLGRSRGVAERSSTGLKNTLVAAQIALSLVLLSSCGLLVRSLWNLETQALGMQSEHVLTAQLVLPSSSYAQPGERIAFFNELEKKLATVPGVRALGISDSLPPGGWERSRPFSTLAIAGGTQKYTGTGGLVNWRYVSPGYFSALQIPILSGRIFTEEDRRDGVNLCILSQSLGRHLFSSVNAIGKRLRIGENSPLYEVIGIVPDVKNTGLMEGSNPEYYILRTHSPDFTYLNATGDVAQRTLSVVLLSTLPNSELVSRLRSVVASLNPTLPVQIESMPERLGDLAAGPRFYAALMIAFAAIGLLLAAIGLYGTISYLVAQRTQEIGIRMSLGATPAAIGGLMLAYSARWTLLGAIAGNLAAMVSSRLLSSLLFQVQAQDPLTLAISLSCLLLAALLATIGPARRASSIDPIEALRN